MPMINEAIFAVMEGVGTPEAIDTVMKLGMNHPMGPLALADFIGLDVCLAILNVLHDGLGDPKYRPCPLLRRMVAAGHLGRKSGRGFYTYRLGVVTPGQRETSPRRTQRTQGTWGGSRGAGSTPTTNAVAALCRKGQPRSHLRISSSLRVFVVAFVVGFG